ncbi:hypothetical protein DUNSADRAFT_18756 [Dunaliella salina]|uniref:Uncharacterized protein n=1 Tax=Dunaliella salina TaxID=3046 RepID=A0ABQ7GYR9_DUNSA|nr:hypothetical protein DUNSADRAFT_18756 [Dunaliella salina]|eukprot:KAF5839754.1 hypothetical protein DUNSADRAFT_18756 [Dunaliella salina]
MSTQSSIVEQFIAMTNVARGVQATEAPGAVSHASNAGSRLGTELAANDVAWHYLAQAFPQHVPTTLRWMLSVLLWSFNKEFVDSFLQDHSGKFGTFIVLHDNSAEDFIEVSPAKTQHALASVPLRVPLPFAASLAIKRTLELPGGHLAQRRFRGLSHRLCLVPFSIRDNNQPPPPTDPIIYFIQSVSNRQECDLYSVADIVLRK